MAEHVLSLVKLDDYGMGGPRALFRKSVEQPDGRRVALLCDFRREEWEAMGRPLDVSVDL